MDKYGEMGDSIYCYPDSDVLKNKLNIQDAEILQQAEMELTEYASTRIEYAEPPYDLKYLQSIHFQLFSDLYAWAGELRQVDIAKGDTRFCTFSRIEIEANKLFKQLEQQNYFQGLAKPALIQKIADFYCELNIIHPFREGNGRTQRIFFEHLLAHCGYGVQWSKINNKEVWIQANIDGFNCRLDGLIAIFEACIITPE